MSNLEEACHELIRAFANQQTSLDSVSERKALAVILDKLSPWLPNPPIQP